MDNIQLHDLPPSPTHRILSSKAFYIFLMTCAVVLGISSPLVLASAVHICKAHWKLEDLFLSRFTSNSA